MELTLVNSGVANTHCTYVVIVNLCWNR